MALNSYSNLINAVGRWLDRDDLLNLVPDLISLGELRINRTLRVINMEATVNTPLVAGQVYYALPCDFISARNIKVTGTPNPLSYVTPILFDNTVNEDKYTITDGQIKLSSVGSGELTVEYYRKYLPLSLTNETNWLTENATDILLYAALLEAEAYLMTDERLETWGIAYQKGIDDLNEMAVEGRYSGDALSIRAV